MTASSIKTLHPLGHHAEWAVELQIFANRLITEIEFAQSLPASRRAQPYKIDLIGAPTDDDIRKTYGFSQVLDALSRKHNATIEIIHVSGIGYEGDDNYRERSTKAFITFGKLPYTSAQSEVLESLLEKIDKS